MREAVGKTPELNFQFFCNLLCQAKKKCNLISWENSTFFCSGFGHFPSL